MKSESVTKVSVLPWLFVLIWLLVWSGNSFTCPFTKSTCPRRALMLSRVLIALHESSFALSDCILCWVSQFQSSLPPLCIFCMSLFVNTPDSDNQLVRSVLRAWTVFRLTPYTGSIAPYTGSIAPCTGSIAPYQGPLLPRTGIGEPLP